ncbi:MAG: hypothetical protein LBH38_01240 [Holosporales bacterium]|jgi:hypothetical protein|nr:hypothetical protein [Holosporales bacterium]
MNAFIKRATPLLMGMLCNFTFAMLEDGAPTADDTKIPVANKIFDIRTLTPEALEVSFGDLKSFMDNGFVLNLTEENLNQSHLQVFGAIMWYVHNTYESLFLVIGESLYAAHAKDRFANPRWFFLDPNVRDERAPSSESYASQYGRAIFQGRISDLQRLIPFFTNGMLPLFSYILDDINVIENNPYSSYTTLSISTCDMFRILFDLLAPGGTLTTSTEALMPSLERSGWGGVNLRGLNDEEFSSTQKGYNLQILRDNWKEKLTEEKAHAYLKVCYKHGRGEEFIQEAQEAENLERSDDLVKEQYSQDKEDRSELVICSNDRDLMIVIKDNRNTLFDARWFFSYQKPGPSLAFGVTHGDELYQCPLLLDWIPLPSEALRPCERDVIRLRGVCKQQQKELLQLNQQLDELNKNPDESRLLLGIKNGTMDDDLLKMKLKAQGIRGEVQEQVQELRRKAGTISKEELEHINQQNCAAEKELQEKISSLHKEMSMSCYKPDDQVRPLSIKDPIFLVKKENVFWGGQE